MPKQIIRLLLTRSSKPFGKVRSGVKSIVDSSHYFEADRGWQCLNYGYFNVYLFQSVTWTMNHETLCSNFRVKLLCATNRKCAVLDKTNGIWSVTGD